MRTGINVVRAGPELERTSVAWPQLSVPAGAVALALILTAGRYGYHRDELYFLQAGQHLAWGYVDQPPLTPLLARLMSTFAPESLVVLRLPSALAAGLVVLLTGLIARDLGASRGGQVLAASSMAVASLLLAVGHLLSTSTFDLLVWTGLSWLGVRALQGDERLWLAVGALAGIGLLNKTLVIFFLAGLLAGVLAVGPRDVLRSRFLWAGAAIAVTIWMPNLIWQARHGWPQLELSRAIAAGSSGTSEPPVLFIPYQLVLISPALVPIWVAGLVRLLRNPGMRRVRAFAVAYLVLLLIFLVTSGKPYYLGGFYPVLLAAGAVPSITWLNRRRAWVRRTLLGAGLGLSAVISATLMLPIVPVSALAATPIPAVNYDAGETVGWPRFAATVATAYETLPPAERAATVLLTENYGEAGALDRYGGPLGLPRAYSGHNSYWSWGPPPDGAQPVITVGLRSDQLLRFFGSVSLAGQIDNGVGLDNDEQGAPIYVCRQPQQPWAQLWPQLRHIG